MFKFLELERFPNKADIFFNEIKTHIQRYKVNLMIQHIQHWKRRLPTNIKNLKPSTLWLMLAIGKEKCQRNKCCGIWRTVSQSGHVSMWLNPMIFYHRDTKSLEQNFFFNILKMNKLTLKPMLMTGIDQLPNSLVMSVNQKSKLTHNML